MSDLNRITTQDIQTASNTLRGRNAAYDLPGGADVVGAAASAGQARFWEGLDSVSYRIEPELRRFLRELVEETTVLAAEIAVGSIIAAQSRGRQESAGTAPAEQTVMQEPGAV